MKAKDINFEVVNIKQFSSPLNEMIVVEELEFEEKERKTASGLFIPDTAKKKEVDMLYAYGYVYASDNKRVRPGSIIAYSIAHGVSIIIPDEQEKTFAMVPFENVYCIMNPVNPE